LAVGFAVLSSLDVMPSGQVRAKDCIVRRLIQSLEQLRLSLGIHGNTPLEQFKILKIGYLFTSQLFILGKWYSISIVLSHATKKLMIWQNEYARTA